MNKTMVSLREKILIWGRRGVGLLLVALALLGCERSETQKTPEAVTIADFDPIPRETAIVEAVTTDDLPPTATVDSSDPATSQPGNLAAGSGQAPTTELLIIYTNDEHGWMEGVEDGRGAAEIVSLWREMGCGVDNCLILSGGDMWTGPAVSSWLDGESMVEVMNAMGYAAAAVGNHEFDFGLERLLTNAGLSEFPFVSANIRRKAEGGIPTEWGIEPFTLVERAGVTIGVVGLSTQRTPQTTLPTNVADFEFIDYAEALAEVVPQARAAGADLIIVPTHICRNELTQLITDPLFTDLLITALGGGHCNELFATVEDEQAVLIGGSHLQSFASARLTLDADGNVTDIETTIHENVGGETDTEVASIVAKWRAVADEELGRVIGYLDAPLERRGQAMQDLITYSWLDGVPSADIAVTNLGGMRAEFAAGELMLGDIVTVMPFNNVIVEVVLTGAEFKQIFGLRPDVAIAGASRSGLRWELDDGTPLEDKASYVVLVNDFMYAGGDEFGGIAAADPEGYNTAIDWRQPVIDWIEVVGSSAEKPLNDQIIDLMSG